MESKMFKNYKANKRPFARYNRYSRGTYSDKISGLKIDIYNTHLDHESELAREEGIKIILKEVKKNYEIYKTPYIIMGDFNCYLEDNLFNIIREEETNNTCFNVCYDNIKNNILGTFHYFKGGHKHEVYRSVKRTS